MTEPTCEQLDDYLDGDLSAELRVAFADHIRECQDCRDAVLHWESSRRLLKSAVEKLEIPGIALRERIERDALITTTVTTPKNRSTVRQRLAVLIAASAVIVAAISFWSPAAKTIKRPVSDLVERKQPDPPVSVTSVSLSFPDDVIGVPIDIGDPNVTVVWLYPVKSQ
jgi:anti-sigma factor RsiW